MPGPAMHLKNLTSLVFSMPICLQLYGGSAESDADVANVLRVLLGSALEGAAAALPALFADQVREANNATGRRQPRLLACAG